MFSFEAVIQTYFVLLLLIELIMNWSNNIKRNVNALKCFTKKDKPNIRSVKDYLKQILQ